MKKRPMDTIITNSLAMFVCASVWGFRQLHWVAWATHSVYLSKINTDSQNSTAAHRQCSPNLALSFSVLKQTKIDPVYFYHNTVCIFTTYLMSESR